MSGCKHKPFEAKSYAAFIEDGEARHERGERQGCCPHCGKWQWPDAFATRTDYLEAMDWADTIISLTAEQAERATRPTRGR